MAEAAGQETQVQTDSCGLTSFHVGEAPTRAAQLAASARGYDLSTLRARSFEQSDFEAFDLILAMDEGHYSQLLRRAPDGAQRKIAMFLEAAPDVGRAEVPDPYYDGGDAYELALDLIEAGCGGWLSRLRAARG